MECPVRLAGMYCKTTALTKIPISPTILAVVALSWFFEAASSLWVAVLGFLARFTDDGNRRAPSTEVADSVIRGQRGLGTVALPGYSARTPGEIHVDRDGQHGVAVTGANPERVAGPGRTRRYRIIELSHFYRKNREESDKIYELLFDENRWQQAIYCLIINTFVF
ncbi:MAG: hypothetical protein V9H25_06045 [Candidatus Competibacter sp.]